MGGIASSIQVNISRELALTQLPSFGVALILSSEVTWSGTRSYSGQTALDAETDLDGDDPAYLAASALFSQPNPPQKVKIGKRTAEVASVFTLTPTVQNTTLYTVTINGTTYSFTSGGSATAAAIVSGLSALITADSACTMVPTGTNTLILTGVAGQLNVVTASSNLAIVATTAKNGVAEDVVAVRAVDDDWYCLLLTSSTDIDNMDGAIYIEATGSKIFLAMSNTGAIATSSTTDIASVMQAKSYKRTALFYSGNLASYPCAAWAGRCLPATPGSINWAYKNLVGVTADNWTDTQTGYLDQKFVNYYVNRGADGRTINGSVAGNDYLDITTGIDLLVSDIQTAEINILNNTDKVPLDDDGISVMETVVRGRLEVAKGPDRKFVQSYTVTAPKYANLDPSDVAARKLNAISFDAVVAGAVNKAVINGTLHF